MANADEANGMQASRRQFVQAGVGLGAAGLAAFGAIEKVLAADTTSPAKSAKSLIKPGDTVLFQGDSITDAGRKRDDRAANSQPALGKGYAWLAAAQLLVDSPGEKFEDLQSRHQRQQGLSAGRALAGRLPRPQAGRVEHSHRRERFLAYAQARLRRHARKIRKRLPRLVKRTKDALPRREAYDLRAVRPQGWRRSTTRGSRNSTTTAPRLAAWPTRRRRSFVPFQTMFDLAVKIAPPATWAADGVHPTPSGGALDGPLVAEGCW